MIRFALKTSLILAVVIGGSLLLVNNVPSLKANILEVVNPRVEEGKMVQQLQDTLTKLDDSISQTGAGKTTSTKALVTQAQQQLQNIADINSEHAGVADGVVGRVTDALFGNIPTATSQPSVSVATTSDTSATASPCK